MTEPYYQDNLITIYNKDCRSMDELPAESVQCVITSPPYWGLRKYAGNQDLIWGDNHCEHKWGGELSGRRKRTQGDIIDLTSKEATKLASAFDSTGGAFCSLCGAWKGAFGLEPTPEMYVAHSIEILKEIRRVLRKDGIVFWNIGDSYATSPAGNKEMKAWKDDKTGKSGRYKLENYRRDLPKDFGLLKPKDLCLIPFRVAISAQEDGWWVRSIIIWSKPNPMPESVTDRPTESHEYILMLTKSAHYYWDAEAVREPSLCNQFGSDQRDTRETHGIGSGNSGINEAKRRARENGGFGGRNIRSVWEFPTQSYPEAHFAVFPEKLPEICIKAATPEVGCCSKCGAPWERIIEKKRAIPQRENWRNQLDAEGRSDYSEAGGWYDAEVKTLGWQPTCKCKDATKTPSMVLDPFMGSGTTLWVAKKLGRRAIGYDISEVYCELALERNRQMALEI